MTKRFASVLIAVCTVFVLLFSGIGFWASKSWNKNPANANSLADVTWAQLQARGGTQVHSHGVGASSYTLQPGRIYLMQVWGARGGAGGVGQGGTGGAGGNGSYAYGFYDMRSASVSAIVNTFAG